MKHYINNGISYTVGCNAEESWKIIGDAKKDDQWVHLDGYPSAHVIIHIDKVLKEELEYAKQLILDQTKKAPKTAKIIYSEVSKIKRGGKVGEVIVCK